MLLLLRQAYLEANHASNRLWAAHTASTAGWRTTHLRKPHQLADKCRFVLGTGVPQLFLVHDSYSRPLIAVLNHDSQLRFCSLTAAITIARIVCRRNASNAYATWMWSCAQSTDTCYPLNRGIMHCEWWMDDAEWQALWRCLCQICMLVVSQSCVSFAFKIRE